MQGFKEMILKSSVSAREKMVFTEGKCIETYKPNAFCGSIETSGNCAVKRKSAGCREKEKQLFRVRIFHMMTATSALRRRVNSSDVCGVNQYGFRQVIIGFTQKRWKIDNHGLIADHIAFCSGDRGE